MTRVESAFEGMKVIATGEHSGETAAHQLPAQICNFVNFVADSANTGVVCIGTSSSVTLSAGTDTTTAGFQLCAKAQSGWLPCNNLNEFWIITTAAGDDVSYICIG